MNPFSGFVELLKYFPEDLSELTVISSSIIAVSKTVSVGCCAYGIHSLVHLDKIIFKSTWNSIMDTLTDKKFKNVKKKFELVKINKLHYGFKCSVRIPKGYALSDLVNIKEILETNYNAVVEINKDQFEPLADLKVITKPFNDSKPFKKIKTEPYQIYIGNTFDGEPVIIDFKIFPHHLIHGLTNSGKSTAEKLALTNLICQHDNIDLYLAMVSSKQDLYDFAKCKQTKYYAKDIYEATKMYAYVANLIKERNKIFMKHGVHNIYEYNKKAKKKGLDSMNYVYSVTDEFAAYVSLDRELDSKYWIKRKCLNIIEEIISQGQSSGIFFMATVLRPDQEHMPPFIKMNFSSIEAFKQMNKASSLTAIDSEEAVTLKRREAIVFTDEYHKIKTPFLNEHIMKQYIGDKIEKNHKYISLEIENKPSKNVIEKTKTVTKTVNNVINTAKTVIETVKTKNKGDVKKDAII